MLTKRLNVKQDKKQSVLENFDTNFFDQLPYVLTLAALSTWLSRYFDFPNLDTFFFMGYTATVKQSCASWVGRT